MKSCESCQRSKSGKLKVGLLQLLPIPERSWDSISMDIITGLPRTDRNHDAIFTFVDQLSKYVHLVPTRCQQCPEITYMAMGFRPRLFPVGGMYVKGIGRLTKVEKKSLASLFHCFLNVKSASQILCVYLTGNEKPVRKAQH